MTSYVVVGAGILGASTAYHLAKSGARVTIVDRRDPGQATDAAAGIVCPWLTQRRNKAWYHLAKNGAKYYPELIKELAEEGEYETGYEKVGAISLHTDEQKLKKTVERAMKRRENAPEIGEITLLSPAETKSLFPPISEEYGSVHVSGGARVNGRALCKALINAAEKKGASITYGDASLLFTKDRVTGVEVEGNQIYGDQVIVTAGAWARELVAPLGINLLVSAQKAQIVHLEMDVSTNKWPVVMPPSNHYLLSFEEGRIIVGATHEDEAGFDNRVTAGGVHGILEKALHVAPGLYHSTFLETRVGFRPMTPGFLPVIGKAPQKEGLLIANGLGASGLTVGPYLGSELANVAMGKEVGLDLENYSLLQAIAESDPHS
ncbi:NAD(P)/FAD-dependent oxidoreductase [Bacillus sp. FJAT-44742]|uniref:NAD(P)/FAD-dependent oxidoreductase n=1 Tax=Bacillus sp. FJAT-44742 TaxID=2014005 RepID=UPI000C24A879|nr:FAD-binding oxidoreductase [Bacillus sp. FJAT-44742]